MADSVNYLALAEMQGRLAAWFRLFQPSMPETAGACDAAEAALREAHAEIERHQMAQVDIERANDYLDKEVRRQYAEVERLRALLRDIRSYVYGIDNIKRIDAELGEKP